MKRYQVKKRILIALFFTTIAGGLLVSCGETGEEPQSAADTTEVVENSAFILADSACESFSSCSYSFRVYMTGSYSDTPELAGNLTGTASDEMGFPLLRIEMGQDSTPDDGIAPELTLVLVSGIDSSYAYSSEENILEKGSNEEGGPDLLRPAGYVLMIEFFLDDPFADEIASQSVTAEGMDTVGTVPCENYMVTYSGGQKAMWSFGVADHLPRRVERMMTDREGNATSIVLEVHDLDISPEISDSTYIFPSPEGASVEIYSAFLTVGAAAPIWTLQDRDGNTVSLEEMRGSIVILDFWATWCTPCIAVMPEIQSIFENYPEEQVHVFGVNVWESGDPGAFMDENGFSYGLLLEGDDVAADYKVSGIPTLYIIDQNGNITFVEVGANPEIGEMLSSNVERLLQTE